MRGLLESAPDAMLIVTQAGVIEDVNAQAQRLFGYSRAEMLGRAVETLKGDITERERAEEAVRSYANRLETLKAIDRDILGAPSPAALAEVTLRHVRRLIPCLRASITVFDLEAGLGTVYAAEDEYSGPRELAVGSPVPLSAYGERTAELEAFSYSVSHDLRVPLRAVDAFSRILEDEYAACMDPEGRRLVGVIRASARSMGDLIEGLLTLARLGSQEMTFGEIDLRELAARVFDELRAGVPDRTLQFSVGQVTQAWGDRAMIRQVLANLLSNAVKFTAMRDRAEIELGEIVERDVAWYYLRDNGVGFDGRYADRLFAAFQRLHAQEEFEGAGVGLAIVRRIVERHGGSVRAEGTLGRGATVYFTLAPRDRSAGPPAPPNTM